MLHSPSFASDTETGLLLEWTRARLAKLGSKPAFAATIQSLTDGIALLIIIENAVGHSIGKFWNSETTNRIQRVDNANLVCMTLQKALELKYPVINPQDIIDCNKPVLLSILSAIARRSGPKPRPISVSYQYFDFEFDIEIVSKEPQQIGDILRDIPEKPKEPELILPLELPTSNVEEEQEKEKAKPIEIQNEQPPMNGRSEMESPLTCRPIQDPQLPTSSQPQQQMNSTEVKVIDAIRDSSIDALLHEDSPRPTQIPISEKLQQPIISEPIPNPQQQLELKEEENNRNEDENEDEDEDNVLKPEVSFPQQNQQDEDEFGGHLSPPNVPLPLPAISPTNIIEEQHKQPKLLTLTDLIQPNTNNNININDIPSPKPLPTPPNQEIVPPIQVPQQQSPLEESPKEEEKKSPTTEKVHHKKKKASPTVVPIAEEGTATITPTLNEDVAQGEKKKKHKHKPQKQTTEEASETPLIAQCNEEEKKEKRNPVPMTASNQPPSVGQLLPFHNQQPQQPVIQPIQPPMGMGGMGMGGIPVAAIPPPLGHPHQINRQLTGFGPMLGMNPGMGMNQFVPPPPMGSPMGMNAGMNPYMNFPSPQVAAMLVPPPPDPSPAKARVGTPGTPNANQQQQQQQQGGGMGIPQRPGSPAMHVLETEDKDDVEVPADAKRNVSCKPTSDAYLFFFKEGELTQYHLSPNKPSVTIGRHNDVNVQVSKTEQSVSRWHATIVPMVVGDYCKYIFKDISTYGSFINGRKACEQELLDCDKIHLGGMEEPIIFLRPYTADHPTFEGLIYKHSPAFHKQWQPRWMVLNRDFLLYFKKKDDLMPVGVIDLSGILLTDTKKPKNSFAVITRGRTYHLYTKTEKEKQAWISAIEKGIQQSHSNPCVPQKGMQAAMAPSPHQLLH